MLHLSFSFSALFLSVSDSFSLCISFSLLFSLTSVCSSIPDNMKVRPLNRTAMVLTWDRPSTIYHPPLVGFLVTYSWVKDDVTIEKMFTQSSEHHTVSIPGHNHQQTSRDKDITNSKQLLWA